MFDKSARGESSTLQISSSVAPCGSLHVTHSVASWATRVRQLRHCHRGLRLILSGRFRGPRQPVATFFFTFFFGGSAMSVSGSGGCHGRGCFSFLRDLLPLPGFLVFLLRPDAV